MWTASVAFAQDPVVETDEETGIEFVTLTQEGDATIKFGIALPPTALEEDADEYIGLLVCGTCCFCVSRIPNSPMPSGLNRLDPELDRPLTKIRQGGGGNFPFYEESRR